MTTGFAGKSSIIKQVKLSGHKYDIIIEEGLLVDSAPLLKPYARRGQLLVVTDSNVAKHCLPQLTSALSSVDIELITHILPAGEASKDWVHLEALTDWLLANHVERADHIIALGGGVVGDITGFAASIVKRGCKFIQIPTSLLAQVDSSVGGKTAINSRAGKNLIGAFYQPELVLIDPVLLESLPRRELGAGFAEVMKYGLIDDNAFFHWCADNAHSFFDGKMDVRKHAIALSVASKARIVAEDEKELTGRRALLNLGHTFGHALEAETGFSDRLLHGEAVAAGMALAFKYSARRGEISSEEAKLVSDVIKSVELPNGLSSSLGSGSNISGQLLVEHMLHDKKMTGGTLPFLLARGIGKTYLAKDVSLDDVADFLDEELAAGR